MKIMSMFFMLAFRWVFSVASTFTFKKIRVLKAGIFTGFIEH
jgi:hypothetical protein